MCPDAERPASVFTSIGKNVTSATTAAFDGQSKPHHTTMTGAPPTSGSAEKKLPGGNRPRPRKVKRCATIATSRPAPQPITYPINTPRMKVWTKSCPNVGSEDANRAAAALGDGMITGGTPKPRTNTSQRENTTAPNSNGIARLSIRFETSSRGRVDASSTTQSAAPSQTASIIVQKPAAAEPPIAASRNRANVLA